MRRILSCLVVLGAAFASPHPALAGDGPAAETFRRAELTERASTDLSRAAEQYIEAAKQAAGDEELRGLAEVRAASCLRRLGRPEDLTRAREMLQWWSRDDSRTSPAVRSAAAAELDALAHGEAAPVSPSRAPAAADQSAVLAEQERRCDELRDALELALSRATALEAKQEDHEKLLRDYRKLQADTEQLRRDSSPAEPTEADEVIQVRRMQIERQRDRDRRDAKTAVLIARLRHSEGKFREAREILYEADKRDPSNPEVRALLSLVSAPLGEREALFERVLETAALAREVRSARISAEVGALLADAARRQDRGDHAGSSAPLEQALARVQAWEPLLRDAQALRATGESLLAAAAARGIPRAPISIDGPDDDERRWARALRGLLEEAGGEAAAGQLLRFHETASVLRRGALPPSVLRSPVPGFSLTAPESDGVSLLAEFVRGDESRSLTRAGSAIRAVGETLVVVADGDTQRRISARLDGVRSSSPSSGETRVVAFRASPARIEASLARRAVEPQRLTGGARTALLAPSDVDPLLSDLAIERSATLGSVVLAAPPLHPFRLTAGAPAASIVVNVLPISGARSGVALGVTTSLAATRRADGPAFTSTVSAGGSFAPGGGMILWGIGDPERADEIAVLVVCGEAAPTAAASPPSGQSPNVSEILLPTASSAGDPPDPPLLVADRPVPGRSEAYARRFLAGAAGASAAAEIRGNRLVVTGGPAARESASAFVARLSALPPQSSFALRGHQVSVAVEAEIVSSFPRLGPAASGAFRWTVLRGDAEIARVESRLRIGRGEIPFADPTVIAAPGLRADVARIVRSPVHRSDGVPEWIDEGLVLSVRPCGRLADGRTDTDISIRAKWFAAGDAGVRRTLLSSWWGDLPGVQLGRGDALLIVGARSPFAAGPDSDRLVLVLRADG